MAGEVEEGKAAAEEHVMHEVGSAIGVGNKVEEVEGEGEIGWQPEGHGQGAAWKAVAL